MKCREMVFVLSSWALSFLIKKMSWLWKTCKHLEIRGKTLQLTWIEVLPMSCNSINCVKLSWNYERGMNGALRDLHKFCFSSWSKQKVVKSSEVNFYTFPIHITLWCENVKTHLKGGKISFCSSQFCAAENLACTVVVIIIDSFEVERAFQVSIKVSETFSQQLNLICVSINQQWKATNENSNCSYQHN